jgi:hypothetical protein
MSITSGNNKNMKLIFILLLLIPIKLSAQGQIDGSMKEYFASPVVEDGKRNIVLQNRCGNRLTLLMYDDQTNLEFIYKPNAFRRKEYAARNFSNRDNFTLLFKEVTWPMVNAGNIVEFDYDPFVTRLKIKNQWEAKNDITVLNIADENVFAISAKTPLLLSIKPHSTFEVRDGLLMEQFTDRGENIVSYVAFDNIVQNRFRVLSDGTCVLQIFENEVVFFGGEENEYQVQQALSRLKNKSVTELIAQNEEQLNSKMNKGKVYFSNPDFQKVLDINHRIAYSGIDEGGACFGALNRIYYLIWVRDGSMTSTLMARAGNTELIKIWTKFLLNNPSIIRKDDNSLIPEFLQIVGSRWTRSEDDGIFYATLSLFSYFKTTGQDDLIQGKEFRVLLNAIDLYLEKTWNIDKKLMISNTVGETPLKADPNFGYDVVNGNYEKNDFHKSQGKELNLNASLYNQVNTYNILMMASDLLTQRLDLDNGRQSKYLAIAKNIQSSIKTKFYDKANDCLFSSIEYYTDGTEGTLSFLGDINPWEGSWATAIGPYFPAPELQLKTARFICTNWPIITKQGYGYCPWNTLSKVLTEYGLPAGDYEKMLSPEIRDALSLTLKYPMPGALTEYNRQIEGWRALPFSAGSLFFSMASQMISSLPDGIAVRANSKIDSISNFRYKLSSVQAIAKGKGDVVISYVLNGDTINNSLQIPDSKLFPGNNYLEVLRGEINGRFRLFSSNAQLLNIAVVGKTFEYTFKSNVPSQLCFEQWEKAGSVEITDFRGNKVDFIKSPLNNGKITLLEFSVNGIFKVKVVF